MITYLRGIIIGKILVLWFDDVEDDVLKDILETVNNAKDNNNIKDIINYKIKNRFDTTSGI